MPVWKGTIAGAGKKIRILTSGVQGGEKRKKLSKKMVAGRLEAAEGRRKEENNGGKTKSDEEGKVEEKVCARD